MSEPIASIGIWIELRKQRMATLRLEKEEQDRINRLNVYDQKQSEAYEKIFESKL